MKIEKKSVEIHLYQRAMRIGEITSSAEYRTDKKVQNLLIFGISIVFQIGKNSKNFSVFQVVKFWKFVNLND